MRTLPRRLAVLAILTTTLAGCGGSDGGSSSDDNTSSDSKSSAAPESDVKPADGKTITGKGYSYTVPEGWDKPKQDIPGTEATDTFAADLEDSDGFADNINVIVQDPSPGELTDDIEDQLVNELEQGGAKDIEARDRTEIDGEESVRVGATQTVGGTDNLSDQYYVVRDNVLYVVTMSYSSTVSQDEIDEVSGSILATFKWAA